MSDSLTPDLNGTICADAGCLDVADVVATIELEAPPELGYPDPRTLLAVPLCMEHAAKLRSGGRLVSIRTL